MGLKTAFKRTCRPFLDNTYTTSGQWMYLTHKDYAESPETFIRAFFLLQKDILELFNYIEPSDINIKTYSHRIHELFLRCCVEIEANCKAILRENGYPKTKNWTINDYRKIEQSHYLSQFEVKLPNWEGSKNTRAPFISFKSDQSPTWYNSYNATKHDRHINFSQANFENLTDSFCGLAALLASQFADHDFSPGGDVLVVSHTPNTDGFFGGIGDYLLIRYPKRIPESERYDFNLSQNDYRSHIFNRFKYN